MDLEPFPSNHGKYAPKILIINSLRHKNTGLVYSRTSLTSCGEGASLASVSHLSSDGVTILYGVDVLLYRPASHPMFPIVLVKTESDFIVRSVGSSDQEASPTVDKNTGVVLVPCHA